MDHRRRVVTRWRAPGRPTLNEATEKATAAVRAVTALLILGAVAGLVMTGDPWLIVLILALVCLVP